jgi:hypothetical protein
VPSFELSAFVAFRFPPEVIVLAVRWYLRFGLSYRDLEELLAERGIEVDHVTLFRWVQRFTPRLVNAMVAGKKDGRASAGFAKYTTVPVGATVHAVADRRGTAVPAQHRVAVVRG